MKTLGALLLTLIPSVALAQTITTGSLPNGVLNQQYSATLNCTNCKGYSYGIVSGSGNLPPGLSLSTNNSVGTISGIPSAVGQYTFEVGLYLPGSAEPAGARTFSINIPSSLTILNTGFPNGTVAVSYNQSLLASGGTPPYSWSITSGALPPGLGIVNNNSIAGTPTTTGTYNFTVTVTDSVGNGSFLATTITVNTTGASGPVITTTSLPTGIVNVSYTTQLTCNNCTGYTWSVTSGLLPLGLTLSAGGAITGTPTTAGSTSFQVTLSPPQTNSTQAPAAVSQIFTLLINGAGLSITQTTIPIGFTGTPYSYTLTPVGGSTPYTWSLTSPPSANDGITIGAGTGTLSGTPTASGTFILSVQVNDSSGLSVTKQFTLSVSTGLSILTTTLPNGSVGTIYPTQTLSAGGGQPPYRWTITTGTLPAGLALDGVFGRISGTPTANGKSSFTLMVTDNQGNTATANLSITIGAGATITITPTTLTAGTVGTAYTAAFSASGGTAPYTWAVTTGTLPAGLALNSSTGAVTGTPTTAGNYSFSVTATDSTQATGQAAISLTISATAPLTITTSSLPNGTVGTAYTGALAATGGTSPYTWALSAGTLPAGLSLNASTGAITGTPTTAATSSLTVQVTDAAKNTATKALGIVIAPAVTPLTLNASALPAGTVGVAYSQSPLTAAGGTPPYSYALSSTSNGGLTINSSTGALSGTPTTAGSFTLTAVVTDSSSPAQTASKSLSFTVNAVAVTITIAPATLPAASAGVAYTQALTATGGASPYKFAVTTGSLPSGFSLSTTGSITGTAAAAETGTFTVTATDANNATGTAQYTLTVNAPSAVTVTLAGVPASSGFQQQVATTPTLSGTYPSAITGTVTLTFTASVTPPTGSTGTIDDAMIQFSGGGRTATFTIPAGSITAPSLTVLTGTTAGTITLTTALSSNGAPLGSPTTQTIVNAPGVPFISKVTLQQVSGGVTVVITGFSSTRDMVNASFIFAPATGDTFTSNNVSVPVQNAFATWYANTAVANPFGTEFTLTIPFTLATATQSVSSVAVVSVTVTLQNSKGASNPQTLSQ
ncbi:MAG TPA: putative Ig domain-containing protein [Bryobacteraceae bacterium]|jgi:hypothetical protein|nr:putative Ig domain-containing protein [Bryobacteraceae bacterium]